MSTEVVWRDHQRGNAERADPRARRRRWTLPALGAGVVAVALVSLAVGALPVSVPTVLASLLDALGLGHPAAWGFDAVEQAVVLELRAPRVLLGMLVGAALAVGGAAMQGLFRNPLADPGLIGVSAGAALAAVASIVFAGTIASGFGGVAAALVLPFAAFAGGLLATFAVYAIAGRARRFGSPVATLLLAGIAVNAVAGAGTGLLTYLADDEQLRTLTFWSMGSLAGASWTQIGVLLALLGAALGYLLTQAPALNALLLGEAEASHLGFDLDRLKRRLIVAVAAAVGAAVAAAGMIGFVGLVVPHLLRLAVGPDHRLLLPAAALLGALLLPAADLAARTLVTPAELPIGILTALAGGPFFLFLLVREGRRHG